MGSTALAAAEPRERGILFTGPNVLKILAGTKTQTRRVVKWKPCEEGLNVGFSGLDVGLYNTANPKSGWVLRSRDGGMRWNDRTYPLHCPYGAPGDRLWVREAWNSAGAFARHETGRVQYRADFEDGRSPHGLAWKPSIHMPRWASRLTLEITEVRVERLQDLREADAKAEGATACGPDCPAPFGQLGTWRCSFAGSWTALHGDGAWASNPWVWALTFRRLARG